MFFTIRAARGDDLASINDIYNYASQEASVAIHAKHGFVQVGHLKQVGYKFDRWLDVLYLQLIVAPLFRD